jgi:hypothetical protein
MLSPIVGRVRWSRHDGVDEVKTAVVVAVAYDGVDGGTRDKEAAAAAGRLLRKSHLLAPCPQKSGGPHMAGAGARLPRRWCKRRACRDV